MSNNQSNEKQSNENTEKQKAKKKGLFGRLFGSDSAKITSEEAPAQTKPAVEPQAAEQTTEQPPNPAPNEAVAQTLESPTQAASPITQQQGSAAKKAQASLSEDSDQPKAQVEPAPTAKVAEEKASEGGFFSRVKAGLGKTRGNLTSGLANLLVGRKEIDDEIFEELETQLLLADVGVEATMKIINHLTERAARKDLIYTDALYDAVKKQLAELLNSAQAKNPVDLKQKPTTIMVVGVNGVGKTTSIGKLAYYYRHQKRKTMLAAGDTFRAAAVEQLQVWGERNDIPVVAQKTGSDSAAVAFDGLQSAQARDMDVLIVDTAGRLHNKSHLMDELKKVKRVMGKIDESAPHETWLVIDAGTGQNALRQVKEFHESLGLTGLIVTKMDGTAKGGIVFALAQQFDLPIRFIGVGEQIADLQPFEADAFIDALFDEDA
ncbi:MAG: signal recognition particle-docking protein FtsY [Pseudomonadota bacterium]|nr:signal recognition particle-docking protein FtsY [Pseudomonadota bacterium]